MITLQQDYITDYTMDKAFETRSLRDDLRDLVLTGVSGLSVLDRRTDVSQLTPMREYDPYRTTDIPDVLSIPLTDKLAPTFAPTSTGQLQGGGISLPYYTDPNRGLRYQESQPGVFVDNSFKDTLLTNPAAVSLETVPVYSGSMLEANYQQLPATLSGQDSVLVPMMNSLAESQTASDNSELVSTSTTAKECWIPGVTGGCWLRKDVRNETVLFIVGAIVLALGILALTR